MNIYEKLHQVQTRLAVPKTRQNSFGGYSYRSYEDIINAVKPLLAEMKLVLLTSDEPAELGGRVYIRATAAVRDVENPDGGEVAVSACARESIEKKKFDDPQITRSCAAYALKSALCGLFAVDDSEEPREMPAPAGGPTVDDIIQAANRLHFVRADVEQSCRKHYRKGLDETTPEERKDLLARIRKTGRN